MSGLSPEGATALGCLALTRRTLCTGSLLAAGCLAPGLSLQPGASDQRLVLYHPDEPGARSLMRSAQHHSVPRYPAVGDLTDLWQRVLRDFWRRRGSEIVGVTTLDALFCLDLLGRDAGQRLVHAEAVTAAAPSLSTLLRSAAGAKHRDLDRLPHENPHALYGWVMRAREPGARA